MKTALIDGLTLRQRLIKAGVIREAEAPNPPASSSPPMGGVAVKHWFYAAMDTMGKSNLAPKVATRPPSEPMEGPLGKLLIENPRIAPASLIQLMKSQGWVITPPPSKDAEPKEADASSSAPAGILISSVKESNQGLRLYARFLESTPRSDTSKQGLRFRCALLMEGLGNLKDAYFYSKESLVSAVPIFEGKKIYADHPSSDQEESRPERSVRDVLGHFENMTVEEIDGRSALTGDVVILADDDFKWARALMRHAVGYSEKYPDKDFVGLSINAGGISEPLPIDEAMKGASDSVAAKLNEAKAQGVESVNWVKRFTEAVSCDLVTEAGAGGRLLAMMESNSTKESQEMEKDKQEAIADPQAGHSDAAQDMELIKKMLAEYLGEGDQSEETMKAADEAMKCAMEMGMPQQEAYESAGKMMKMAKHMSAKKEAAKVEPKADEPKAEEEPKEEPKEEAKAEAVEPKESAALITLKGENAALKEKLLGLEILGHLDTVLKESHLPMVTTKAFREALGDKPKSKEEIDTKFKLFREGLKAAGEGDLFSDFVIQPEKHGEAHAQAMDFSDCIN